MIKTLSRVGQREHVVSLLCAALSVTFCRDNQELYSSEATGHRTGLAAGGELLRVSRDDGIRLATSTPDGRVVDAIELRAAARVGEIALAEPDGRDGSWVVVHLWRERPMAADQYEVLHIVGTRVLASFAVADRAFTDTPPLSRFRIGGDGELYQLVSTAAGIRIVRFDLKEER